MSETTADRRRSLGEEGSASIGRSTRLTLGILMILAGGFAIVFPLIATVAYTLFVGAMLIVGGAVQSFSGIKHLQRRRAWLELGFGLLGIAAGVLILFAPLAGMLSLTILLSTFFFADAIMRFASMRRGAQRYWALAGGVLSLFLAALIVVGLPQTALYTVGMIWGVHALFVGAAYIAGRMPSSEDVVPGSPEPAGS